MNSLTDYFVKVEIFREFTFCDIYEWYFHVFSGVKAVDKKDGSGSHNWGTFEDEIKAEDDKANISAENMNDSTAENENPENSQNATNEIDEAKKVWTHWISKIDSRKPNFELNVLISRNFFKGCRRRGSQNHDFGRMESSTNGIAR